MSKKFDFVKMTQEDWSRETEEPIDRGTAEVIVDRMCEAFFQAWEGDHEYAVRMNPGVACHLMWRWTGEDGRKLRAVMAELGVSRETYA